MWLSCIWLVGWLVWKVVGWSKTSESICASHLRTHNLSQLGGLRWPGSLLLRKCCACIIKMVIRLGLAELHPQSQAPVSGVMLLLHVLDRGLLRYFGSCPIPVYHIRDSVHAGLELLQPAIARQAEQCHFSVEDGSQLLFMAAAAAACLAEASQALHVSLFVCCPSSAWCMSVCWLDGSSCVPSPQLNCIRNRHAVTGVSSLQSWSGLPRMWSFHGLLVALFHNRDMYSLQCRA